MKKLLEKYQNIEGERFFKDVFEEGDYREVKGLKADVVVDVGALAGEFSAYIYDQAQIIYALEPYPSYYKELTENIEEFNLNKIKPFNLALSNYNGEGFIQNEGSRGASVLKEEGEKVKVKTLAKFMKDQEIDHIDILKIDIEGGEVEVFGSEDISEVIGKIDYIIGEHLDPTILRKLGFKHILPKRSSLFKHE